MKLTIVGLLILLTSSAQAAMVCEVFKTDNNWNEKSNASIKIFKLSKEHPQKDITLISNPDNLSKVVLLKAELKERTLPNGEAEEYGVFMVEDHGQFIYANAPKNEHRAYHRSEDYFFTTKCY